MALVTMKDLLEAGVHFGHQTRRWHPKMKRFIYHDRNGIYIIDLHKTLRHLEEAYEFIRDVAAGGGTVLFVGTKRQAQEAIESNAERCGMPHVNQRWLGGMLTNFETMRSRIRHLEQLESDEQTGVWKRLPKKEVLSLQRERDKLLNNLGGIRNMTQVPDAVYIVDLKREQIAAAEARALDIPVVAIVDTNCDPDMVDFVIPGNDDAIRAIRLMTSKIADAVLEGAYAQQARAAEEKMLAAEAVVAAEAEVIPYEEEELFVGATEDTLIEAQFTDVFEPPAEESTDLPAEEPAEEPTKEK